MFQVRDKATGEVYTVIKISEDWGRFFAVNVAGEFKIVNVRTVVSVDKPMPDKKPERKKEKKQIRDFVEGRKSI